MPRFRGDNLAQNQRLIDELTRIAREKGVTTSQLVIAWVLAKGERIVPVIGAGTRYDAHQMRALDSEK